MGISIFHKILNESSIFFFSFKFFFLVWVRLVKVFISCDPIQMYWALSYKEAESKVPIFFLTKEKEREIMGLFKPTYNFKFLTHKIHFILLDNLNKVTRNANTI